MRKTFGQRPEGSESDTWGRVAEESSRQAEGNRQALSQGTGLSLRQAV